MPLNSVSEKNTQEVCCKDVEAAITRCLDHFAFADAISVAEAYYYRTKTEGALYLLAKSFMLYGKTETCYAVLKSGGITTARCRYLIAKCAYDLKRLNECELYLRDEIVYDKVVLHPCFAGTSTLLFANTLLSKILVETNRADHTTNHLKESISNPLLWTVSPALTQRNIIKVEKVKKTRANYDIRKWIALLADVQEYLSRFRCTDALNLLDSMELCFAKLPLSLEIRARIYFESGDYARCCDVCEEIRQLYPWRCKGMEIYSTSLWHLQDAHRLSALCAEMVEKCRDEPETWCVAGNSFSLEKQHETAVECLERAIRVDPRFGYAYSLLGHELIIMNDLTRAEQAFRSAIVCAPNDYRAWYGLGLAHYKAEKLQLAKANLLKAVQINPTNIIVLCQLSVIEQSLKNNKAAMEYLERALNFAPNNVACLYHKARLLFDTGYYKRSMDELLKLKHLSPDEAHVFYLLGRVYRKLGDHHMALLSYSWATEIDPRGEQNHSALSDQGPYDDDPVDFNEND